ncbi:thymidine kinase [Candidatus Collierbacteria bacterium CG1_02_44_10]|uniref:Thymidine kinase n=2 Tax=Candidatus Collieribacteriota TaxID=1752725 RepID=A0A2H0DUI0_9BACT|nr:MAG: thymidine kinase [Candidatus Collierbacteria bacterium CG1_02_44_10]PIP85815.1 MAG: thymidine kinase [Candidatus Collierbacteria bacterium CG22_combo_CG10-13_8_21_14_all_43_12]PIZ24808.1 MAG: thymidine kinase [Candidatus Collierbacteria bacterium CG_4_10_14_0_8_um_filter_43_86]
MTEKLKGISGSMFAGKTEELISEINRAEIAKKHVLVIKPRLDDRWGEIDKIKAHSGAEHDAYPVSHPQEILTLVDQYLEVTQKLDLVAIDEVQFMSEEIIDVIKILLEADIKVTFSGLATDFRGEPFGPMPTLLALSDEINKLTAICTYEANGECCGQPATKTQRIINGQPAHYNEPIVLIGAEQKYQARCPNHHQVPGKPKPQIK